MSQFPSYMKNSHQLVRNRSVSQKETWQTDVNSEFTERDIQMAINYTKRFTVSFIKRAIQIKSH